MAPHHNHGLSALGLPWSRSPMSGSDSGSDEDSLLWSRGLSGGDSGGEGGRSNPPIDNNHWEVL